MIKIGDRVQYSGRFLRSIGAYTGPAPFARGVVLDLEQLGGSQLALIGWNSEDVPPRVNVNNLHRVGYVENA